MKMKKIVCIIAIMLLVLSGCGGGDSSGDSSSFTQNTDPIDFGTPEIENTTNENNISSKIIEDENGNYKIYVNNNQRTAFKFPEQKGIAFYLKGDDWKEMQSTPSGEFAFLERTNYDKKKIYKLIVVAQNGFGKKTEKKAIIYVNNINSQTLKSVIHNDTPLSIRVDDESKYFITTWQTDINGSSREITIPTFGDGYDYSVDWGDGSSTQHVSEDIRHKYRRAGRYTVKIFGDFPRIFFGKYYDFVNQKSISTEPQKLLSIEQWGDIKWFSMEFAFDSCFNLVGNSNDRPNLSNVTSLFSMFSDAKKFNQDIGDWDVSNIRDMGQMFYGTNAFNQNINNWDVSNVTNMSNMFNKAKAFNQNLDSWNVSNVANMSNMFAVATSFNQNISSWNVSSVIDMSKMFIFASSFNQNISNWNVSNVVNMSSMFAVATTFNKDIGNWNVSSDTNMSKMFFYAKSFDQDISAWDVSQVKDFTRMFAFASSFNQNLSNWTLSDDVFGSEVFTGTDSLRTIPSWYNIDYDINTRDVILIGWNSDKETCNVTEAQEDYNAIKEEEKLDILKNIDTSTFITSIKSNYIGCEVYGKESDGINCIAYNAEESFEGSCVIGFNYLGE